MSLYAELITDLRRLGQDRECPSSAMNCDHAADVITQLEAEVSRLTLLNEDKHRQLQIYRKATDEDRATIRRLDREREDESERLRRALRCLADATAERDVARHNEIEIRKHLACRIEAADRANAEVARLSDELSGLRAVVIQPWTRDGDGKKLFKINLAWFDSAETYEAAQAMVQRAIESVKRKGAKTDA